MGNWELGGGGGEADAQLREGESVRDTGVGHLDPAPDGLATPAGSQVVGPDYSSGLMQVSSMQQDSEKPRTLMFFSKIYQKTA